MIPNPPIADPPRRGRLRIVGKVILIIGAILINYALSYAPIYRITRPRLHGPVIYRPVEWLIDRTPLAAHCCFGQRFGACVTRWRQTMVRGSWIG